MAENFQGRSAPGADGQGWKQRAIMPTLVVVAALVSVVSSLGAPLIPSIARADGVSLSTGEWLLTATLMTGALATPVMGRLADGPFKRGVIEVALSIVCAGCVLSALSTNFITMVIGRGLQGVGLGLLPVTMAIARSQLPSEKGGRAIATLSVTGAVGAGLGYPLTALIAQVFDIRAAFWFGAITVATALALAAMVLPGRTDAVSRKLDVVGMATLGVAVVGVSVVLSEGGGWGWTSGRTLGFFGGCVVLVACWIRQELKTADPLIDVRQVRNRSVLTADVSGFLIATAMYLFLPIIVEFVQIPVASGYGFGASVLVAGFVLVPLSVGSFSASRCLVAYQRRFGVRSMIPFGSLTFAAAALFFAVEHRSLWEAFVAAGIAGVGMGFTFAAMPGFIVRAVPVSETGSATGFYQVLRSIGLSVGSALAAAILTASTPANRIIPRFGGFHATLLVAASLAAVAAVLSYLLPGRSVQRPSRVTEQVEQVMEEEAELGATNLSLGPEPLISTREVRPR
ncbi:MAG: Sugar transporter [Acidimicrobiaceae bacterium]|nr:Sugar transporter [Acidimicrobiaceae bacterium]